MPLSANIHILSIDSGGIRGVISFIFLMYIKQALFNFRYLLQEHFNLICGTSAGTYKRNIIIKNLS
jgi:patatin-like phospholipase/acyl hydrolase